MISSVRPLWTWCPILDVKVCWSEGSLDGDSRSRYADVGLINETFDLIGGFTHYTPFKNLPSTDGAVVIIHGGNQLGQADYLLGELNKLKWAVVMVVCDDEANFNTRLLCAPNRIIWQQMPIPGRHDFAKRRIICGYPGDCKEILATGDRNSVNRPLNWFFAGQVNHSRRCQCCAQLEKRFDGFLLKTNGFWQGLTRQDYYDKMVSAKLVISPEGPVTPDCLRMAEALEAGCLPIIGDKPGARVFPNGFWPYVLGENPPFPVVSDWATLPKIIDEELSKWPKNRDIAFKWWQNYKLNMQKWLIEDIQELQNKC